MEYYTDGACSGNPGPGAWAMVSSDGSCQSQAYFATTNNRMELMAVIAALRLYKNGDIIWSDSQYVVKGCKEWLKKWIQNDLKGVKNPDLWGIIYSLNGHLADIRWIKGHNKCPGNIKADRLAVKTADLGPFASDEGYAKTK